MYGLGALIKVFAISIAVVVSLVYLLILYKIKGNLLKLNPLSYLIPLVAIYIATAIFISKL